MAVSQHAITMRLLDPRFKYVPALATDVAETWRRFGFNPRENERRRATRQAPASSALPSSAQAVQEWLRRVAAARLTV